MIRKLILIEDYITIDLQPTFVRKTLITFISWTIANEITSHRIMFYFMNVIGL